MTDEPLAENCPGNTTLDEIVKKIIKRYPFATSAQLVDIIRTKYPDLEINSEVCQCLERHRSYVVAREADETSYGWKSPILGSIALILFAAGTAGLPRIAGVGAENYVARVWMSIPFATFGLIYAILGLAKDKMDGAAFMGLMVSGFVLSLFTWHLLTNL